MTLSLSVDGQKVGYVQQPIEFEVTPSGVGETIADSLLYEWNFGDGRVATGQNIVHSFQYPGKYVVTVYGSYKRQEQVARYEITILPVTLSLTRNEQREIQISNDSPYEIDISQYQVSGSKTFTFPAYSILLPNQTVTLPSSKVGTGFIVVRDAAKGIVVSELQSQSTKSAPVAFTSDSFRASLGVPLPKTTISSAPNYVGSLSSTSTVVLPEEEGAVLAENPLNKEPLPAHSLPYLGLIATIVIGLVGTGLRANRNQTE